MLYVYICIFIYYVKKFRMTLFFNPELFVATIPLKALAQRTFPCSKSAINPLEIGVKYVQS